MLRPLVWSFVLFVAFPFASGQSRQEATETEKLKLEQEKFAYEKHQSNRNLFIGFVLTRLAAQCDMAF